MILTTQHRCRLTVFLAGLLLPALCLSLLGSSAVAQVPGGGNAPPGIAGTITNITAADGTNTIGSDGLVKVAYHLNYPVPFSGNYEPNMKIGKLALVGTEHYELWKKHVLPVVPVNKRLGPADHTLTVNIKVVDGHFKVVFNTDSDVGQNAEFQMFFSTFEIDDGVILWSANNNGDSLGVGGPVINFPYCVSTAPRCTQCTSPILSTLLTQQNDAFTRQGDSQLNCSTIDGQDFQRLFGPNTSIAGCGSCAGGTEGGVGGIGLEFMLRSNVENLMIPTGAGLGYGSDLTDEAYLVTKSDDSVKIRFMDVGKVTTFSDRLAPTDPIDGKCYDEYAQYKEARLLNGGALEPDLEKVTKLEVEYFDGSIKYYDVLNDDEDKKGDQYAILTAWEDFNGNGISFNRSTGVLTGPFGESITISMNTSVAGRASISSIDLGSATANFTYTGYFLSKVEITENSTTNVVYRWTNQVGVDATTGAITWTTDNPASGRKIVFYSPDHGGFDGHVRSIAANKMLRVERGADGAEQLALTISPNNVVPNQHMITFGTNVSVFEERLGQWQRYIDGTSNESTYEGNFWLDQGGTIGMEPPAKQWTLGAPDYRLEDNGTRIDLEYDSDFFLTKRIWGEGETYETYELFQYDARKNLTFFRDRNGNVTTFVYNAKDLMIEKHVGQKDVNGDGIVDLPTPSEYGIYTYTYNANDRIEEERDPLYNAAYPNLHRTKYTYDGQRRLIKTAEAAFVSGGNDGETQYTYNSQGQLASITDPIGRVTSHTYDSLGRLIKTTYNDTSTEETLYGTVGDGTVPNQSMLVIATKNRNNMVTTHSYDWLGRRTESVVGAAVDSTLFDGIQGLVSDPTQRRVTTYTYIPGLDLVSSQITNGRKTDSVYDYRMRVVESTAYPNAGASLTSKTNYVKNQVFYTEDPYGRRKYRGYREHDRQLLRQIQGTVPSFTVAGNAAVLNKVRDLSLNANFIITDAIRDAGGQLIETIDGRGVSTNIVRDSRGQEIERVDAVGTSEQRKIQTDFDLAGNPIEVRLPRYFDTSDVNGNGVSKTTTTYNGRNMLASQTVALTSTQSATTYKEYLPDGRVSKSTDARGHDWYSYWHNCCGRTLGHKDPEGHGAFSNNDYLGQVTHTSTVADYATHTNSHNPIDASTLRESTTRYDALGRVFARTDWYDPQGTVDPNNVSIAGLDGVAKADGSTTQFVYDDNLTDGLGLDSTSGVTVAKLGGGTYNISLNDCLSQLADTTANGGAGVSFTAGQSAGSATVRIDAEERLSVTIADGAGRSVFQAIIQPHHGSSPNSLIGWSCSKYDETHNITGFGDCHETWTINALGNISKRRTDGTGRVLETVDAENNIATAKYDAGGNVVESRDANGVGADRVYDSLGRVSSQTDTHGDSTSMTYNLSGQVITETDAKNKTSTNTYDAVGRVIAKTDRNSNTTVFTYDAAGNQLTAVDAEGGSTAYQYDTRGRKFKTTYPDHTGGMPGDPGYGIVERSFDAAGRLVRKTDQAGDTITYNYNMVDRLLAREYRLKINSPSGPIADTDTFAFNHAGQVLTATSGRYSNTVAFTYDEAGQKASESLTIDGQTYTSTNEYDSVGRLAKLTHPYGDEIQRSYTPRGQLDQVKHNGVVVDSRTYDAGGRLNTSTYGNGVVNDYDYRADDNLVSDIKTSHPAGVVNQIGDYAYTYDANKNKLSETITGAMSSFGFGTGTVYDDENRLTAWNRTDGNRNLSWALSAVGDWDSQTINSTPTSRTHTAAHEISTIGSSTVQHDVKGNLTLTNGRELVFDQDNQLSDSIAWGSPANNSSRTFRYDAFHRRVTDSRPQGTAILVHSGQQLAATYNSGTPPTTRPTTRFIYGSYIDEPILMYKHTAPHYFHRNQQYSITGCTDGTGEVSERYTYDAYGKTAILAPNTTPRTYSVIYNTFMYTGRSYGSTTNLYYFRARWYDPKLGRFIGRDPLEYVDGMSMYSGYFSPNDVDPSGTCACGHDDIWNLIYRQLGFNPFSSGCYNELARNTERAAMQCIFDAEVVEQDGQTRWDLHNPGGAFGASISCLSFRAYNCPTRSTLGLWGQRYAENNLCWAFGPANKLVYGTFINGEDCSRLLAAFELSVLCAPTVCHSLNPAVRYTHSVNAARGRLALNCTNGNIKAIKRPNEIVFVTACTDQYGNIKAAGKMGNAKDHCVEDILRQLYPADRQLYFSKFALRPRNGATKRICDRCTFDRYYAPCLTLDELPLVPIDPVTSGQCDDDFKAAVADLLEYYRNRE